MRRSVRRTFVGALAVGAAVAVAVAGGPAGRLRAEEPPSSEPPAAAPPAAAPVANPAVIALGDEEVRIHLPPLADLAAHGGQGSQRKGAWSGKLGASEIWIELRAYPRLDFGFHEPEDVTERVAQNYADPDDGGDPEFRYAERTIVAGAFGAAPYASLCTGAMPRERGETGSPGDLLVLGAVMDLSSYSVRVIARPGVDDAARAKLREFLVKGISARSRARDPRWTEEEATGRWKRSVKDPEVLEGLRKVTRTEHYIVFTNSSAGALFAKKMEECYDAVRAAFPFEEVEGRRLMPVFLFRLPEQYYDFCVRAGGYTQGSARKTKGHARGDYYATYYESPNDPTHIHEATHQIFRNRLRLSGGGSWFQEGVAEYMETSHNERKAYARRAAREGSQIPFAKFVQAKSLLHDGDFSSTDGYHQAGSLIELLRDGPLRKESFLPFLRDVGSLPRGNLKRIEAAVRKHYDLDLAGLERAWVEYWRK